MEAGERAAWNAEPCPSPAPHEPGMGVHASIPSTPKTEEAKRSRVQATE